MCRHVQKTKKNKKKQKGRKNSIDNILPIPEVHLECIWQKDLKLPARFRSLVRKTIQIKLPSLQHYYRSIFFFFASTLITQGLALMRWNECVCLFYGFKHAWMSYSACFKQWHLPFAFRHIFCIKFSVQLIVFKKIL